MKSVESLLDQLYRKESARLLAVLTRLFGPHNLDIAEDTLQESFSRALVHWQENGVPDNPAAWIMQTAKNRAIDTIRANKTKVRFSQDIAELLESEWSLGGVVDQEFTEGNIKDDQLRMIFMCCYESITPENRIPFILKTLCGFSISAVSHALLVPEATIKKRLLRTRERLTGHCFEYPDKNKLPAAMDSVHTVLYLLFNEGFYCSDAQVSLKRDFCREAMSLVNLLIDETSIVNQDTYSLYALMHFHFARIDSRIDDDGFDIPIDQQNRSVWHRPMIAVGEQLLLRAQTAESGASGRFYWEAKIAWEHCRAEDFSSTNWVAIKDYYQALLELSASAVLRLHHAISLAYSGDVEEAIDRVQSVRKDKAFRHSHMPLAALAHFYAMSGQRELAYNTAEEARSKGGSAREHHLMMRQLERLLSSDSV